MRKSSFTPLHSERHAFENWEKRKIKIKPLRQPLRLIWSVTGFTLMEILVVILIIGLLVTVGVPSYQNFVEQSRARVCEENQRALKVALDIYVMENDQLPAVISSLPEDYIKRAYAKVISGRDQKDIWRIKLGYFLENINRKGIAYASEYFIKDKLARGNLKLISCPMDSESPLNSTGGISYGFNSSLANMTSQAYRLLAGNTILIGDCEQTTFSNTAGLNSYRHKRMSSIMSQEYFAIVVRKDGTTGVVHKGNFYGPGTTYYKRFLH